MASYVGLCGSEHCMLALRLTVCTISDCVVGVLGF